MKVHKSFSNLDIGSIFTVIKLRGVFDKETKLVAVRLFFLNSVLTFFELLGLAAVPGYISLIFAPNSPVSLYIIDYFRGTTSTEITLAVTFLLALFFCMKFIFNVFLIKYENKFVYHSTSMLSLRVASTVGSPRFLQISDSNEGEKIKLIESDASRAVLYLRNCIVLMKEVFIFFAVTLSLAFYDIIIFIFSVCMVSSCLVLYEIFFKRRLVAGGQSSRKVRVQEIQSLQKIINLNLLLKIYAHLSKEIKFYSELVFRREEVEGSRRFFAAVPKLLYELIIVLCICSVVLFLNLKNELANGVTILAVFGVVAVRLVPTVNSIVYSISELNYQKASIVAIHSLLSSHEHHSDMVSCEARKLPEAPHERANGDVKSIELNAICFSYGKRAVLNSINFKARKGQMIGIFGPSGSGKSTLLQILSGYLSPTTGSISLNGKILGAGQKLEPDLIGYVPQESRFFAGTLDENIIFDEVDNYDKAWLERVKSITGVDTFSVPNADLSINEGTIDNIGSSDSLQRLSGGQQQRVSIARAIFRKPKILLCDEITSALDNDARDGILKLLSELKKNCLIFIVSHDEHVSSYCDKNYFLESGKFLENV